MQENSDPRNWLLCLLCNKGSGLSQILSLDFHDAVCRLIIWNPPLISNSRVLDKWLYFKEIILAFPLSHLLNISAVITEVLEFAIPAKLTKL